MKWIKAGDIKTWVESDHRQCAQLMPELIQRLIFATADTFEEIEFPSGDSVAHGGWDGRLRTSVTAPFFPCGSSGWEISAEKSARQKAEEDFAKRTGDPAGLDPKNSTFVFVTPRSWPGRFKWRDEKRAGAAWKGVEVVAADSLELWLDSAPAVALWLARQIGKVVPGSVRDMEGVWEEWSLSTKPQLTTQLVISGRTRESDSIHKWLDAAPSSLVVQGDSPDEAFAFLYAAIAALSEPKRTQAFSRCMFVPNAEQLRECTQAFSDLIIAAQGDCMSGVGAAVEKGHHVFVSADSKTIAFGESIRLSRPRRGAIESSLQQSGLSPAEASQIARNFGRSIPALRRHLSSLSAVRKPHWMAFDPSSVTLPALLAGSWNEAKEGDREVLAHLSGRRFPEFQAEIGELLHQEESPIHKIGDIWMLKSPLDTWFLLSPHLTKDTLKHYQEELLQVLTQTHPKYDLPPNERWAAAIHGKSCQFSESLRVGLVESLAMLSIFGSKASQLTYTQGFAAGIVSRIFVAAVAAEAWATLSDVTPMLAEAAPEAFLEHLEERLENSSELFVALMKDDDSGFFGECRHSGLLWALEGMAWSPEYFARTVALLSDLARIDPGGTYANRPINSLKELFIPGRPQTHASPAERLAAFSRLANQNPTQAWEIAAIHFDRGFFSESHRFRWRETGGDRQGLEPEDQAAFGIFVSGFHQSVSDLACARGNLISASGQFIRLSPDIRDRLLKTLEDLDPATFSGDERDQLLHNLRSASNWIASYGKGEFPIYLPGLKRVLQRFAPTDALQRVGWLFRESAPRLPDCNSSDWYNHDAQVKAARRQAARELLDQLPLDQILDFADTLPYAGFLANALGAVVSDPADDSRVLEGIVARQPLNPVLVSGYSTGRVLSTNIGWVEIQIERLKATGQYSHELCAQLYSGAPEGNDVWQAVRTHGDVAERAYWQLASGRTHGDRAEDLSTAIVKLLDYGRPQAALALAGDAKAVLPSAILKRGQVLIFL